MLSDFLNFQRFAQHLIYKGFLFARLSKGVEHRRNCTHICTHCTQKKRSVLRSKDILTNKGNKLFSCLEKAASIARGQEQRRYVFAWYAMRFTYAV